MLGGPKASRRPNNGEPRKKKRQGVYEVHVHKIRVESDGVKEIHEVRTFGKAKAGSEKLKDEDGGGKALAVAGSSAAVGGAASGASSSAAECTGVDS